MRIPLELRRNPQAEHVKKHIQYRAKKGKPKAGISSGRGEKLAQYRFNRLGQDYRDLAEKDLDLKARPNRLQYEVLRMSPIWSQIPEIHQKRLKSSVSATVSHLSTIFPVAEQIATDFNRTQGLKVFGFGVGHAPLLFVLKKFMGVKTRGVDVQDYGKEFTTKNRLGVIHNKDVADPSLRKLGTFDVTYSTFVLQNDLLDRETALGMLDNARHMTRPGGRSYHMVDGSLPVTDKEILAKGFRIDDKKDIRGVTFLKLTRV